MYKKGIIIASTLALFTMSALAWENVDVTLSEGEQSWDTVFEGKTLWRGTDNQGEQNVDNQGSVLFINGTNTKSESIVNMNNKTVDVSGMSIRGGAKVVVDNSNLTVGYYKSMNDKGATDNKGWQFSFRNNIEGGTSGFYLKDNSNLTVYSQFYGIDTNADKGTTEFGITGDNSHATIMGLTYLGGDGITTSGTAKNIMSISGSNSSITAAGVVIGSGNGMSGEVQNLISVTGKNNKFINTGLFRGRFQFGFNNKAASGENKIYAKGDGADVASRVYVQTANDLELWGSNVEGSTVENVAHFAGNATFANQAGTGAHNIQIGQTGTYGTSKLIVEGSGNDMKINAIRVGATNQDKTAKSIFQVIGGGSDINIGNQFQVTAANGSDVNNQAGGILNFNIDSTGISTVNVNTTNVTISGYLNIDFSSLTGSYENEKFTLISFNKDIASSIVSAWYAEITDDDTGLGSNAKFYFNNDLTDSAYLKWETEGNRNVLNVYYSSIPEPSTYAAIFGALALAFVAYRRRK